MEGGGAGPSQKGQAEKASPTSLEPIDAVGALGESLRQSRLIARIGTLELELEVIPSQMAQMPVLRGEVGARA